MGHDLSSMSVNFRDRGGRRGWARNKKKRFRAGSFRLDYRRRFVEPTDPTNLDRSFERRIGVKSVNAQIAPVAVETFSR